LSSRLSRKSTASTDEGANTHSQQSEVSDERDDNFIEISGLDKVRANDERYQSTDGEEDQAEHISFEKQRSLREITLKKTSVTTEYSVRKFAEKNAYIAECSIINMILTTMQIQEHSSGHQERGCTSLWRIVSTSPATKKAILALDGISIILNAVENHSSNQKVLEQACGALGQLAFRDSRMSEAIGAHNGISNILKAMQEHRDNGDVQKRCCSALCNLAFDNEINCTRILRQGGITHFVKTMEVFFQRMDISEKVLCAMNQLTKKEASARKCFLEKGGVELLSEVMKVGQNHNNIMTQGCAIYSHLILDKADLGLMKIIHKTSVIPLISEKIDYFLKDSKYLWKAFHLLFQLSYRKGNSKSDLAFISRGNILDSKVIRKTSLVINSHSKDAKLLGIVSSVLRNACHEDKGRENICKYLGKDLLVQMGRDFPDDCANNVHAIIEQVDF